MEIKIKRKTITSNVIDSFILWQKDKYSNEDIQKLLVKPDFKTCSFVEYRDWVMVNYFIETGNRLHSVVNIKVGNVYLFGEDLASDIDEHSIVERIKPTSNRLTKNKRHI